MFIRKKGIPRQHQIIVSLTSTSFRIQSILPVIKSLLCQSFPPDKILLWISKEEYLLDKGINYQDIPKKVRNLAESGRTVFEIRYVENTGPFRKLLPALSNYKDNESVIVTADDDLIYPDYWLERLYRTYLINNCITCYRAREITINSDNNLLPYSQWSRLENDYERKGFNLCATGNKGVLYSSDFFTDKIFDPAFKKLCPSRCDVWFTAAAIANHIPTKLITSTSFSPYRGKSIIDSLPRPLKKILFIKDMKIEWPELWLHNKNNNDNYIKDVFNHFNIVPSEIF